MLEVITPSTRTPSLDEYESYAHLSAAVQELRREAAKLAPLLRGRTVWMVNSTARGGGVAEMLPCQLALLQELGVDARWLVMGTDRTEFFDLTKRLHNLIHGAGEPSLSPGDRELYEAVSREVADDLKQKVGPDDLLVVHDPQPAGAGALVARETGVRAVWRCHIGLDEVLPQTTVAWEFLRPHLEAYDQHVFTATEYIPRYLGGNVSIITPAIDPLSQKNRPLSHHHVTGVLCNGALSRREVPVLRPNYEQRAQRLQPDGSFALACEHDEIGLAGRPIVSQTSRWDRLKGWQPLLEAFVRLKTEMDALEGLSDLQLRRLELCRLVLVGPEPAAVADDPEALGVLDGLRETYMALAPAVQKDIALLSLPMVSLRENALMVNCIQRCSTVVVQNSLREGFGLTVTEAMWKAIPVLAAPACGIRQQIRDGLDGRLHRDAEDTRGLASDLVRCLSDSPTRHQLGHAGQLRVHEEFLVFRQLRRWLRVLTGVLGHKEPIESRPSLFAE